MVDSDDNMFCETDIPYMVEPNTLKLNLKLDNHHHRGKFT